MSSRGRTAECLVAAGTVVTPRTIIPPPRTGFDSTENLHRKPEGQLGFNLHAGVRIEADDRVGRTRREPMVAGALTESVLDPTRLVRLPKPAPATFEPGKARYSSGIWLVEIKAAPGAPAAPGHS